VCTPAWRVGKTATPSVRTTWPGSPRRRRSLWRRSGAGWNRHERSSSRRPALEPGRVSGELQRESGVVRHGNAEELRQQGAHQVVHDLGALVHGPTRDALERGTDPMLHHARLRPPPQDYRADEWHFIEKSFHPEFLPQMETVLALGNGYLGMRGCPEEGGPTAENGTFINGFYETWPIVYGEEAYGFAKTGQTIVNVTDSKIIKLFVDDEPFWLPNARCVRYDRRLNMRAGTLDRELLWETPAGTQVLITSRRLVSFVHRHVAAISYQVTLLNAAAPVVLASEMVAHQPNAGVPADDPQQARAFGGRVLQPRVSYARERRVVLCHATDQSRMILTCATDHDLETACPHTYKVIHREDVGQVAFTLEAQPGAPIHLTKYLVYHTSQTASPAEVCGRAEWTMDRVVRQGFQPLLAAQEQYLEEFWRRSDVRIRHVSSTRVQRSTVEIQQEYVRDNGHATNGYILTFDLTHPLVHPRARRKRNAFSGSSSHGIP